jgi:tetratricopeptide (TPR) repeat protein
MAHQPSAPDRRDIATAPHTGSAGHFLRQALAAYEAGLYQRAEVILRQIVEQRPDDASAWHLRGLTASRSGDLRHAVKHLLRAVESDKGNAAYCGALAEALSQLGRDADAVGPWQRAVDIDPENPAWRAGLAHCLLRQGRYGDAVPHFCAAAYAAPADAGLQAAYGYALQRLGSAAAAATQYRAALAIDPMLHVARLNLAAALRDTGDNEGAIAQCLQVLEHMPRSMTALNNLGAALCSLGRNDEAIRHLRVALQCEPENLTALHNMGVALTAAGAPREAETCLRKALILQPDSPDVHRSLANLMRTSGRIEEAAQHYRAVIDGQPLDFRSYGNLGLALLNLNRPLDAIAVYEKALALGPEQSDIRMSLGIAQLLVGDFANGWVNYDARWQGARAADWRPELRLPRWQGRTNAAENPPTVLVHAEQGFGDTVHFCRYLPLVAATGARVVFECQPPLASLMATLAMPAPSPDFRIIAPADPALDADFHVPLLSLPTIFGTTLETIPARVPYLSVPPAKSALWAADATIGEMKNALRIGLVWSGNPGRQDDHMRSCPVGALAPLFDVENVQFYGLAKEAPAANAAVVDLGPRLADFGDTAAVMGRLDLVISVDTASAHLAGALGRPVWVMLGFAADWRYLLDRDDSPWYPTMRLFRQDTSGDWLSVTRRIAGELRGVVLSR